MREENVDSSRPYAKRNSTSVFHFHTEMAALFVPMAFALAMILLSIAAGFTKSEYDLVFFGASYGPRTIHEYWRLVGAIFLETKTPLILVNAAATFYFGRACCRATGPLYFCSIYLGAGASGILVATILAPQAVIFSSSLGPIAIVGSLIAAHFFDRRRQPTSNRDISLALVYLVSLSIWTWAGNASVSLQGFEVAAVFGFAGAFFLRVRPSHLLSPITGLFCILIGLRIAIGSLPSTVDRFELESSVQSLKIQTAHTVKTVNEKFTAGELTDLQLADQLRHEVLEPTQALLKRFSESHDRSLNHKWLESHRAELKYRASSLETIIDVSSAKNNLLEADELARHHNKEAAVRLDKFWYEELPQLHLREKQLVQLAKDYPKSASDFLSLRSGLAKDIRSLAEGAGNLETQAIEEWIETLKNDVMYREERMPSSALAVSTKSDYIPPGISEDLKFRMERAKNITEILTPFLPRQESELQHLSQLQSFLSEMKEIAERDKNLKVTR